jgi:hypothetical protein
MQEEDRDDFGKDGHLRHTCEHITFASYVAIETYLIDKLKDYFHCLYKAPDREGLDREGLFAIPIFKRERFKSSLSAPDNIQTQKKEAHPGFHAEMWARF